MLHESVSARYADALFQAAEDTGKQDEIQKDLRIAVDLLSSNRELETALKSPAVPNDVKKNIIIRVISGRTGNEVRNFLLVMADRGRLSYLKAVLEEFDSRVRESKGILLAHVETAVPIDDEMKKKLAQSLAEWKKKPVQLVVEVNPEILGGVIVRIGDHMVDGSLSGGLREIDQNFQKTAAYIR
ncbi:MAG: ATP synthase F1 subunit delta [Chloroflexi bacterium]|nr:ATP synthase F1 subunit delta [Chloroflexota bacterium]